MTDRELMQQALDALDLHAKQYPHMVKGYTADAAEALRARLAQPEQEPVAWADMAVRGEDKGLSWTPGHFHKAPLYTTPPQRTWQGLTDEEPMQIWENIVRYTQSEVRIKEFARAIEVKLKEKNNA